MKDEIAKLVTTQPEAEIAADIKRRLGEAMIPVLAIFDEAAGHGFLIQWDGIAPVAPFFKHKMNNPRIVKHY